MNSLVLRLLLLAAGLSTCMRADSPPLIRPDDVWVSLGDSITENGQAKRWIEYYVRTRRGGGTFRAINAGVGGDNAGGAQRRLEYDVIDHHPSVVSVMFGMNDVGRHDYAAGKTDQPALAARRQSLDRYETNMRAVVKKLRAANVRVVLVSPTSFEHSSAVPSPDFPGLDAGLKSCEDVLKKVGASEGVPVVNCHELFGRWNDALKTEQKSGSLIAADRVHPNDAGQFVLAVILIKETGLAAERQMIGFDAKSLGARGAGPLGVHKTAGGWEMDLQPSHLPVIIDPPSLPEKIAGELRKELGEDILCVRNLPSGRYEVVADGTRCGVFSHQELSEGVAFDRMPEFPLTKQSKELFQALINKGKDETKLRLIAWSEHFAFPAGKPSNPSIDDVERGLRALQEKSSPQMKDAIDRRLKFYRGDKEQESAILERIQKAETTLSGQGKPTAVRLRIAPASR